MWVAAAALVGLIVTTLFEVVARYVFNAPTIWAFDMSYMFNGGLFLLAIAYTLSQNGHIRVDVLSAAMPWRLRSVITLLFFLGFLVAIGFLAYYAGLRAWRAYATNELDPMTPWAPKIWPFYTVMTVGLASFWLQVVAESARELRRLAGHAPHAAGQ